jgi:threonine/homoserine/homoserine lactone efflux protein
VSIAFLLTTLVIVATPGTGVLYTLAAGLSHGTRASVIAAIGCTLGIVPHMVAAITGLAALLHTSAVAFQLLKYLGVGYLLYMAWTTLRDKSALTADETEPRSAARVILSGILINILNPKLTIFFFAFLPQFVSTGEPNVLLRMMELSAVFMLATLVIFIGYGVFAASVRRHVISRPRVVTWMRRTFAGSGTPCSDQASARSYEPELFPAVAAAVRRLQPADLLVDRQDDLAEEVRPILVDGQQATGEIVEVGRAEFAGGPHELVSDVPGPGKVAGRSRRLERNDLPGEAADERVEQLGVRQRADVALQGAWITGVVCCLQPVDLCADQLDDRSQERVVTPVDLQDAMGEIVQLDGAELQRRADELMCHVPGQRGIANGRGRAEVGDLVG